MAGHNLISQTVTNDDGTHALILNDVGNTEGWASATISFDANWAQTGITGTADVGGSFMAAAVEVFLDQVVWFATPYDPEWRDAADLRRDGAGAHAGGRRQCRHVLRLQRQ
ncbi:MAG: hypothetical protein WDM81_16260 [Rhizomicrobium sp.]